MGPTILPNPITSPQCDPNLSGKRDQRKPNNLLQTTVPRTKELFACLERSWGHPNSSQGYLHRSESTVNKGTSSAVPQVKNEEKLHDTIGDYLQSQAIRLLKPHEVSTTQTWTPIFGVEKRDSTKVRIITDLRILNKCCRTPHHKPETWKTVLKLLQDPLLTWATKPKIRVD